MTEQYLLDHRRTYRRLAAEKAVLSDFEQTIGYTPIVVTGMPRGFGQESSKIERQADKLMELRSRITALEQQWLIEQEEIEQALDQLTETEANVFRAYYCTRQSWARVGEILDYSERQLYRIRKSGLKKLAEMK